MKKCLFILLLAVGYTMAAQGPYTLKYTFEKGKTYSFETYAEQKIEIDKMDTPGYQIVDMSFNLKVNDITPEGYYDCRLTYTKMRIESSLFGENMQTLLKKSLDPMVGLGYNLVMTTAGKIKAVSGVDEFVQGYAEGMLPDATPGEVEDQAIRLREKFTDSLMIKDFERISCGYLPETPVKIKDHWLTKSTISSVFSADVTNDFTLVEVNNNTAILDCKAAVTGGGRNYSESGELSMDFSGKGRLEVDMTTGLSNGTIVLNGKGTANYSGKKVKMKLLSTNTYTQRIVN